MSAIDPTYGLALITVGSGLIGYVIHNERRIGKADERLARIETKLDLLMENFHLTPTKEHR